MWDKLVDGTFKFLSEILGAQNAVLAIVLIFLVATVIITVICSGFIYRLYHNLILSFDASNKRLADVNEVLMQHHEEKMDSLISAHREDITNVLEGHRREQESCEKRYQEVREECRSILSRLLDG